MADPPRPEPDGRSRRRLSLGAARDGAGARADRAALERRGPTPRGQRTRLLPQGRGRLRRHHLMSTPVIRADGISKRYKLGATYGYKTVRESLSGAAAAAVRRGRAPGPEAEPRYV